MQKHRHLFSDPQYQGTCSDIQRCLRLNDLSEIGDGTHFLDFWMLGLFSFRQWSVPQGVRFWMDFLDSLGLHPDTVTVHPDKRPWQEFYQDWNVNVREDPECTWSDGQITGYCTEFYLEGVEIGNIVNPGGDCLDCGFGLDRIQTLWEQRQGGRQTTPSRQQILERTIGVLLDSGIRPGPQKQSYVLRSLIRDLLRHHDTPLDHPLVTRERERIKDVRKRMERLRNKHPDKPREYFWETHGIHPDDWE